MARLGSRVLLLARRFPSDIHDTRLITSKFRYRACKVEYIADLNIDENLARLSVSQAIEYPDISWFLLSGNLMGIKHNSLICDYGFMSIKVDYITLAIRYLTIQVEYNHLTETFKIQGLPKTIHYTVMDTILQAIYNSNYTIQHICKTLAVEFDRVDKNNPEYAVYAKHGISQIQGEAKIAEFDIDDIPDLDE